MRLSLFLSIWTKLTLESIQEDIRPFLSVILYELNIYGNRPFRLSLFLSTWTKLMLELILEDSQPFFSISLCELNLCRNRFWATFIPLSLWTNLVAESFLDDFYLLILISPFRCLNQFLKILCIFWYPYIKWPLRVFHQSFRQYFLIAKSCTIQLINSFVNIYSIIKFYSLCCASSFIAYRRNFTAQFFILICYFTALLTFLQPANSETPPPILSSVCLIFYASSWFCYFLFLYIFL